MDKQQHYLADEHHYYKLIHRQKEYLQDKMQPA